MVERLFLAVPRDCLRFVIVVFPDHTHLGGRDPTPGPGKSQVYLGFLINTATDPLEQQFASNCFSSEVRTTLCKKIYDDEKKTYQDPSFPRLNFLDSPMRISAT